jgi:putative ABC transport system substrate-binding protein
MLGIRRREFTALLASAAAWPLAGRAQPPPLRIGVLSTGIASDPIYQGLLRAFTEQLRKLGLVEGKNLHIEYRWNGADPALTRDYVADLVALAPDVILSLGTINLVALQRLSPVTPIVFIEVSDPVAQGFVTNMAHPGANITGFALYEFTIGGKWLDLLKQMWPPITHVAVIFNPETGPLQSKFFMTSIESAARTFNVVAAPFPVQSEAEIDPAIARFAQQANGGLILMPDVFNIVHRKTFAETAARYRVPAISGGQDDFVSEGGLMSYTVNLDNQFRQAAVYVDRILKGTKPGDLPVQTPTKFSLRINLKAARGLGIEVPLSLLLIADEQIE